MRLLLGRILAMISSALLATGMASHHASGYHLSASSRVLPTKESCAYSAHEISILDDFDSLVGRRLNCVQVYANVASTWSEFIHPWFINYTSEPNLDWSAWATAPDSSNQLVITLNLFPSSVEHQDWLDEGAAGDFSRYDEALAKNLVAAGLGRSIIRLAPEMNGTWYDYSLGSTPRQWRLWDRFWARTVQAMRSVPGAEFSFDWCISTGTRALPWSEIYPGNDVVDIIGMDVYDNGPLGGTGAQRWRTLETENGGVESVLSFAHRENRPISIPDWGVATRSSGGGGDDAAFVNGIGHVVAENPTVYQSYFFKYGNATQLVKGPRSLAAYRRAFGANGYAVDDGSDTW